ncbi:trans-aconitate 2-methyltransferase [Nonomuraea sp. NPDC003804]|uniref:trans-aconitate 2-methyltransferase n=1 Tax=Nonomuraea sp. NPDC003804 TaxID=3154547 RepID=UPI0033A4D58A
MSRDIWDPATYAKYAEERGRPYAELVGRVYADAPDYVVDAGCGSGELTATLAERWPEATVYGFDSSPAMISKARELKTTARFDVADVTLWHPDRPVDVLVSNALLHWVPTHRDLFERWVDDLSVGGWLAFQMPGNFDAPSHVLVRQLCASEAWRDRLGDFERPWPVAEPVEYVDQLSGLGLRVDAWETTYVHILQGERAVLNWISGSALRPIFDRLDAGERQRFLDELAGLLDDAYPARPYGTLFPFRRVFVVGQKVR